MKKINFQDFITYKEFCNFLKKADNNIKGEYSEEFFKRWFSTVSWLPDNIKIYNLNDSKSKKLISKYPELKKLKIGTKSSRLADLLIDYIDDNEYDLISAKWWADGLTLKEIGSFYGLSSQGYPHLKSKIVITNAPRTSKAADEIFDGIDRSTRVIFEDEFICDYTKWQDIKNWKEGTRITPTKWKFRNFREYLSLLKAIRELTKNDRCQFQAPPGWGKTLLMFMIDLYFWKKHKGITVNFADSGLNAKQNFDLFTTQYDARGIKRPVAVICPTSMEKDDIKIDWPVEIMGRDPAKIRRWIRKNPDGLIFCFYGNTKALQKALGGKEVTVITADEAGRSCQPIGTGWSHCVHDHLIKAKKRFFVDATPKIHRKYGMMRTNIQPNVKLYGHFSDYVTQSESEKYGSTCGFYIKGLVIKGHKKHKILKRFINRDLVKGKPYDTEQYIHAYQIMIEKAEDPNDEHGLGFLHTIKKCNEMAVALNDVRNDLIKHFPKNKKYQRLKNIEIYVADTHIKTNLDIHTELDTIYEKKKRSIVLTSRLLYRAWSNVKIDSISFGDNFTGKTYIVQALGRGLRINPAKPNKLCKIVVPADASIPASWEPLIRLINLLKGFDYRPLDHLMNLVKKKRSNGVRKPIPGGLVINGSGVNVSIKDIRQSVKTYLVDTNNEWLEWTEWHTLAKEFFKLLMIYRHLIVGKGGKNYLIPIVYEKICANERYREMIKAEYKAMKDKREIRTWFFAKMNNGFKGIKEMEEFIEYRSQKQDIAEENVDLRVVDMNKIFDLCWAVKMRHPFAISGSSNQYTKAYDKELKACVENKCYPILKKWYPFKRLEKAFRYCRYNIIRCEVKGMDKEQSRQKDKQWAELRLGKLLPVIDKAREIAIHLHIYHKVSFKFLQKKVIEQIERTDLEYKDAVTRMDKYAKRVLNKSIITPNAKEFFERKTAEEKGGPYNFTKDQLICTECGVQPCRLKVKAERHKGIPWMPRCGSCDRKKKLATPYFMSGKAKVSENNRRKRQRERKKVA